MNNIEVLEFASKPENQGKIVDYIPSCGISHQKYTVKRNYLFDEFGSPMNMWWHIKNNSQWEEIK